LTPLIDAAASTAMTLIVGAPVRLESRLHIAAFIVCPNRTLAVYTKRHLGAFSSDVSPDGIVPPAEATVFEPGTSNPLVQLGEHTAAIAVCAEIFQRSHPQQAAERGAKSYLTSHFGIPLDRELRYAVLRAYAVRHGMAVVFANYGGPTGGLVASGGSAIWSESGELLARLESRGSGVVIATESQTGWHGKAMVLEPG
jgi:predicted amidohydrolase